MLWLVPKTGAIDFVACTWMQWTWELRIRLVHNEVVNRGVDILRFVSMHPPTRNLFWISSSRSIPVCTVCR